MNIIALPKLYNCFPSYLFCPGTGMNRIPLSSACQHQYNKFSDIKQHYHTNHLLNHILETDSSWCWYGILYRRLCSEATRQCINMARHSYVIIHECIISMYLVAGERGLKVVRLAREDWDIPSFRTDEVGHVLPGTRLKGPSNCMVHHIKSLVQVVFDSRLPQQLGIQHTLPTSVPIDIGVTHVKGK